MATAGTPFFVIGSAHAKSCTGKRITFRGTPRVVYKRVCTPLRGKQMFVKHGGSDTGSTIVPPRKPANHPARFTTVTHRKEFRDNDQNRERKRERRVHTHTQTRTHRRKSRVSRVTHRGCTRLYFDYGYSKSKRGGGRRRGW